MAQVWVSIESGRQIYSEIEPKRWYEKFENISDPQVFISHMLRVGAIPYKALTRDQYEALCRDWGVDPVADSDLGDYGDTYGHWFMSHYLADPDNRQYGVERTLRQRRWWAVETSMQHTAPITQSTKQTTATRTWGSHGVRYDERCDRCGSETEVDNDTGYCRSCQM